MQRSPETKKEQPARSAPVDTSQNATETASPEAASAFGVGKSVAGGPRDGGDGGGGGGTGGGSGVSGLNNRQQNILAMQQRSGNASVLRMIRRQPVMTHRAASVVQRDPPDEEDAFKITPIIPAATSTSVLLSQMRTYIQNVAEHAKKPELVQQTIYYVLTDMFYVFDSGGAQLGAFGTMPNAKTFPPGIFALDSGNVWTRFGRQGKEEGFFAWGYPDPAVAAALRMEHWLSAETLAKVNSFSGKASLVLFAVSKSESNGSGGPAVWGREKYKAAKNLLDKGGGDAHSTPDKLSFSVNSKGAFAIIHVDGATQAVDLYENESPEDLLKRIQKATGLLRDSLDPSTSIKVAGGAEKTGFSQKKGPDEIPPGATGTGGANDPNNIHVAGSEHTANAPGYKADITFYGSDKDKKERAHTAVNGATNRLSMELDYNVALTGSDMLSQVTARMQTISYTWELIDVTNVKVGSDDMKKAESQKVNSDNKLDRGEGADIERTAKQIQEDKDNSSWAEKAAWFAVQDLSDTLRFGGTLVSSYISLVTTPLNERSVGWSKEGDYIVRCIATPIPYDGTLPEGVQRVVRASSVAIMPVRVLNINTRATEQVNKPDDEIKRLQAELEKMAPDDPKRPDLEARIAGMKTQQHTGAGAATKLQIKSAKESLALLDKLDEFERKNTPLKERTEDVNQLDLMLTTGGLSRMAFRQQLEDKKSSFEELDKGIEKNSEGMISNYRPHVVLVSEENGQTYQMLMSLGEVDGSDDGKRHYRLVDATSAKTMGKYDGESAQTGLAGHSEAIRNAFVDFRENGAYGRGSIAIKMPEDLEAKIGKIAIESLMHARPGVKGRAMQRLKDLATAAEVASLVVGGPAGMAIGVIGGIAGGVVAANNLMTRVDNARFKWLDLETATDIIGIIGAFAGAGGAVAGVAESSATAKALAAGAKLPSWVNRVKQVQGGLHIFGIAQLASSGLLIPIQLLREFDEIEKSEGSPGEKSAKRLASFLGAVKSGIISVATAAQMMNGGVEEPKKGKENEAEGGNSKKQGTSEPENGKPGAVPVPGGGSTANIPKAKSGVDVTAANWVHETAQAMGSLTTPSKGRIKVIEHDQLTMIRGGEAPEGVVGFRDTAENILYVSRGRLNAANELRVSLLERITGRISTLAKSTFGEALTAGYRDRAINDVVQDSAKLNTDSPLASQLLALRLELVVGVHELELAMFNSDGVMAVRNKLKAEFGSARANAIETAMKNNKVEAALKLLDKPNPGLSDAFGETLSSAVLDMMVDDMKGTPRDPARAKLAKELADKVGMDTLSNAYLTGQTEGLQSALETAYGKEQAAAIKRAFMDGQIDAAQQILRGGAPEAAKQGTGAKAEPPKLKEPVGGSPSNDAPESPGAQKTPSEPAPLREHGSALKTVLENKGNTAAEALATIFEMADFRMLREMIKEGRFGTTDAEKSAAQNALQTARIEVIDNVLKGIAERLQTESGGKIKIEFKDLGTPGFKSDRDVTISVKAADGASVSQTELIAASVKGVRDAYAELNQKGLPPDAALDCNFYTELKEGSIKPANAAERSQIVADQSIVSLAEMRMNMKKEQWEAYREKQLKSIGDTGEGSTKILQDEARARTEAQFKQAEAMAERLNTKPKEAMLRDRQEALLKALDKTPPASAVEIRQLMADIKLLEPDAYGTHAAYSGVVEYQQKLARANEDYAPERIEEMGKNAGDPISDKERRAYTGKVISERSAQLKELSGGERLALLTQEASASAGKMYGHAHENTPTEVRALAKYLSRIDHAFREAGLKMKNSIVDETGEIVGTKQEIKSDAATMAELKTWAQDRNMTGKTDQQICDAWVAEAQAIGEAMVTRLRTAEQMKHAVERGANDPTSPQ